MSTAARAAPVTPDSVANASGQSSVPGRLAPKWQPMLKTTQPGGSPARSAVVSLVEGSAESCAPAGTNVLWSAWPYSPMMSGGGLGGGLGDTQFELAGLAGNGPTRSSSRSWRVHVSQLSSATDESPCVARSDSAT